MTKLLFSNFFWADWRGDTAVRACGLAARGLWIDALSLMAAASPVGHLVMADKPVTPEMLARLVGETVEVVSELLEELERNGVFSRTRSGVIYSRRMTRDAKKIKTARENGRKGGNPNLCNSRRNSASVNPQVKEGVMQTPGTHARDLITNNYNLGPPNTLASLDRAISAAPSRARRVAPPAGVEEAFERLWLVYPRRPGNPRKPAFEKFVTKVKAGADPEAIIAGAKAYAILVEGKDPQFTAQTVTWLNQERWTSETTAQPAAAPNWDERTDNFYITSDWAPAWGPKPSEPGCLVPPDIIEGVRRRREDADADP